MLTEACATQKPVYIFPFGYGQWAMGGTEIRQSLLSYPMPRNTAQLKAFLYSQLMRFGPRRLTRDIRLVHEFLVISGRAVWLSQEALIQAPPPLEDLSQAVTRVKALFFPTTV
jgi:hypothetical protein